MEQIITPISTILVSLAIATPIFKYVLKKHMEPKYIAYIPDVDNWISIKNKNVVDKIGTQMSAYLNQKVIFTDGETTDCTAFLNYDADGDLVLNYTDKKITHWQPMPLPPKGVK